MLRARLSSTFSRCLFLAYAVSVSVTVSTLFITGIYSLLHDGHSLQGYRRDFRPVGDRSQDCKQIQLQDSAVETTSLETLLAEILVKIFFSIHSLIWIEVLNFTRSMVKNPTINRVPFSPRNYWERLPCYSWSFHSLPGLRDPNGYTHCLGTMPHQRRAAVPDTLSLSFMQPLIKYIPGELAQTSVLEFLGAFFSY